MTNFNKALNDFVQGTIDFNRLEQILQADLAQNSSLAEQFLSDIEQLAAKHSILPQVAEQLSQQIKTITESDSTPSDASQIAAFPDLLKLFQAQEIGYRALEKGLLADLTADPNKQQSYVNALNRLSADVVISRPVFADLMAAIDEFFEQDSGVDMVAPVSVAVESSESQVESSNEAQEDEDEQHLDEDKTEIRITRKDADEDDEGDEEDKTQIKIRKVDNDQTQIGPIKRSDREDDTSSTGQTSGTLTSGTASTWSKPFESSGEGEKIIKGSILKERFKITGFIGHGGMGDVFKAEDITNEEAQGAEREIAIKVLNKEFREHRDALKSLSSEATKTRQLNHPNIVSVFDFDRDSHNVFMTMELMVGDPLNKAIKNNPRGYSSQLVRQYVQEMGSALGYAHSRGVIHCDFKPGNIFLSDGVIKVFDFGIARAVKRGSSIVGKDSFDAGILGAYTPSYASPEMIEDSHDPEPQDDIYALGCITYELLTGSHPFIREGKKVPANKARDLKLQPKPIKGLRSWQWQALANCLEFERTKRTATVKQFTDEFLALKKPMSLPVKIGITAACVGLVAAGGLGWQHYRQQQVVNFIDLIESNKHDKIKQRLAELLELDPQEQQRFFAGSDNKALLLKYFEQQVPELIKQQQYQQADELVSIAEQVHGNLVEINDLRQQLNTAKATRIAQLDSELTQLLDDEDFVGHYTDLKTIWDSLKLIDSNNPRLSDVRVALVLEDNINLLIADENYAQASQMAEFALILLADNQAFENNVTVISQLKDSIGDSVDSEQMNQQIAELENQLLNLDNTSSLADYQPHLDTIKTLSQLAPDNQIVTKLLAQFNQKFTEQQSTFLNELQWQQANDALTLYEPILSSVEFNRYNQQIESAKKAYDDKTNTLIRQITIISDTAEPNKAEAELQQLIEHKASESSINNAKDIIAKGWLKQARRAIAQRDWTLANNAIEAGNNIAASDEVKTQLQTAQTDLTTAQTSVTDDQQLQAQKTQQIDNLSEQINQRIQTSTMTVAQAKAVLELIDDLEVLDQSNVIIQTSKDKIAELLGQNATTLAKTDLEQALGFANQAYQLMPTSQSIAGLVERLTQQQNTQKADQKAAQLASITEQINQLLANDDFHLKVSDLEQSVALYEQNASNENQVKGVRSEIAKKFVNYSNELIEQERFDDATKALNNAERFDSSLNSIDFVKQQLTAAKTAFDAKKELERQQALIESLKQSFTVQINAKNVNEAEAALARLAQQSGNEVFIATEANGQLLQLLDELIDKATNENNLTQAVTLLEKKINYADDKLPVRNTLAKYKLASDIKQSATDNPQNTQNLLNSALQQYPNDPLIEKLQKQYGAASTSTEVTDEPTTIDGVTYYPSDQQCEVSMAGRGKLTRQTCYDMISDKTKGPRMVVMPQLKGSHFAISRYEITIADYNTYCRTSKQCQELTGVDRIMPVTGITIDNMKAYATWLSSVTGKQYQLPTKEQWDFAAQAAKPDIIWQSYRNCKAYSGGNLVRGIELQKVNYNAKKSRNDWGLIHYLGNASEVVQDGSNWVAAGGSWDDPIDECKVGETRSVTNQTDEYTGFRLVRTM